MAQKDSPGTLTLIDCGSVIMIYLFLVVFIGIRILYPFYSPISFNCAMLSAADVCVTQTPPALIQRSRYLVLSSMITSPGSTCMYFSLDKQVLTSTLLPNIRCTQSRLPCFCC